MKKFTAILFVAMSMLDGATFVLAQTVTASYPAQQTTYCPQISAYLYRGTSDYYTGGQVTRLQQFLNARYGNQLVTGYFGAITQANVAAFQREQNVYPVTGGVGPLTRAAIARVCGGTTTLNVFEASPSSGSSPLEVAFKINSIPAGADMASLYVDFGDGQTAPAQTIYCFRAPCIPAMTSTHTYTQSGTYSARLMQNNNYCAPGMYCAAIYREPTVFATVKIVVSDAQAASYNFSVSPNNGNAPLPVTFTMSTSITNNDGSYIVDFGDGTNATMTKGSCVGVAAVQGGQGGVRCSSNLAHTYQNAGTYTATLSPYIACMYSNPRCMIATQSLGSATVTVR